MNLAELQRKLIAAARRASPSERVPLAFEKRITALLQAQPLPDHWALWARALWRSAAACLAVVLVLGAVSFFAPKPADTSAEMSDALESTLLAGVDQDADSPQ